MSSGLDVNDGLNRIGSYEKYEKILQAFFKDNKNFHREFHNLIIRKKFKAARLKAHALKGAAGNVSAKNIQLAAEKLEICCTRKDRKQILKELKALKSGFSQLENSLKRIKPSPDSSIETNDANTKVDVKQVLGLVTDLDHRLSECDPVGSERTFNNINPYLSADAFTTERKVLEQQICVYQFDDAREHLRIINTKLKKLYT